MNRNYFLLALVLLFFGCKASAQLQMPIINDWNGPNISLPWFIDLGSAAIDSATDSPNPSGALHFIYRAGLADGNSPGAVNLENFGSYPELWFGYYFKYSPNFNFHPVATKQIYVWIGSQPNYGNFFVAVGGDQHMWFTNQPNWGPPGSVDYRPNIANDPKILPGVWYWVSFHCRQNTPGQQDGLFELWINGNLVMQFNDVPYRSSSQSNLGFGSVSYQPVWGGVIGAVNPVQSDVWFDHTVISTTPITSPIQTPPSGPSAPTALQVL